MKITTNPTSKGERYLDVFSALYKVKRLKDVPLEKFNDSLWIEIKKAESQDLITIKLEEEEFCQKTIEEYIAMYFPNSEQRGHPEWKPFHDQVINKFLEQILPDLRLEVTNQL
jgi:transcriptional accessory protein Tex/SPT6